MVGSIIVYAQAATDAGATVRGSKLWGNSITLVMVLAYFAVLVVGGRAVWSVLKGTGGAGKVFTAAIAAIVVFSLDSILDEGLQLGSMIVRNVFDLFKSIIT